ncbi:inositol monophosphatase family protein [Catenuloplanes japonicus]|uniref:inositol monophosphatase family protein n=1 Tax=Catenuloplanes japonicus TaxID=33876 RepID=UPI000524C4FA|nr:inositol monophosphatase family protein [Catenuloplanes japonicus]
MTDALDAAREVARLAGAELLRRFRGPARIDVKSSVTDLVSDADRAAEAVALAFLRRHRPDDSVLGEEGASHDGASEFRWVVDPLDGTVNYLSGIPFWCVSVGCERRDGDGWRPWLGVVYDPVHDELFHATADDKAHLNGEPIRRAPDPVLADAVLSTGFAYDLGHRGHQSAFLAGLLPEVRGVRMVGSTALALCWVAAGRLDIYVEDRTKRWDYAAGWPIAAEAGADVRLVGSVLLAAPPTLADGLATRIAAHDLRLSTGPVAENHSR